MCSFLDRRTKETYFSNPLIFKISSQTPTLPQRITDKRTTKRTKFRSDFAPKQKKKQKLPTAISPKAKSDSPPKKIPSSVSDRKAEKQSTAKRSAGCLSKASSCASDERSFAAGPKLQTAVFSFCYLFLFAAKKKK